MVKNCCRQTSAVFFFSSSPMDGEENSSQLYWCFFDKENKWWHGWKGKSLELLKWPWLPSVYLCKSNFAKHSTAEPSMIWLPESVYLKLAWVFLHCAGVWSTTLDMQLDKVEMSHTMVYGLSLYYFYRLILCVQC